MSLKMFINPNSDRGGHKWPYSFWVEMSRAWAESESKSESESERESLTIMEGTNLWKHVHLKIISFPTMI